MQRIGGNIEGMGYATVPRKISGARDSPQRSAPGPWDPRGGISYILE